MSDAKSQSEMETVLSSVPGILGRRRSKAAAPGKLVLTQDLRVASPLVLTAQDVVVEGRETQTEAVDRPDPQDRTPQDEGIAPSDISALTAKIAALERAIAQTTEQWEPHGVVRDAYSGKATSKMQWQEEVELDATGQPMPHEPTAENATAAPKTAGQGIDEDGLRDIVSDILRSELQGDLGKIITRNLHKMVQREVERVLALHKVK